MWYVCFKETPQILAQHCIGIRTHTLDVGLVLGRKLVLRVISGERALVETVVAYTPHFCKSRKVDTLRFTFIHLGMCDVLNMTYLGYMLSFVLYVKYILRSPQFLRNWVMSWCSTIL